MREVTKISKRDFEEIRWKVHVYGDIYLVNRYIRNTYKHIGKAILRIVAATLFMPIKVLIDCVLGLFDIIIDAYDNIIEYFTAMKYLIKNYMPFILIKIKEDINDKFDE